MATTLTPTRADTPATKDKAPVTGTSRRGRGSARLVWAGGGLVAALALALGAAAVARDEGSTTIPAHADVVERGSPRAVEGTVEETAVVVAHPGMAVNGSPAAIDGRQAPSGLAAPAHSSLIEHGSPVAMDSREEPSGLAAPAHSSLIEHGSPTSVDAQ